MGNTWEPGRDRFWETKEIFEYVESRSLALGDGLTELSVKIGGRTCRLLAERVFDDAGEVILGRSEEAQTRGLAFNDGEKTKWRSGIGKRIGGYSSVAIPKI
jgi:hypothetical protein